MVDNLNIHTSAALYETLTADRARKIIEKLEIHYTPKHGSWLNMAEIELRHLGRQCLHRRIGDPEVLAKEVAAWYEEHNTRGVVDW